MECHRERMLLLALALWYSLRKFNNKRIFLFSFFKMIFIVCKMVCLIYISVSKKYPPVPFDFVRRLRF